MPEHKAIHSLALWIDPVARSGPEAMAVDELLLLGCEQPILRVYSWSGKWVSFGYFDSLAKARESFKDPALQYLRRWTGGGVVDHRDDWTYTLILPRGEPLAEARGAESYAEIHRAVAQILEAEEQGARVLTADSGFGAAACFENPVKYDVADLTGKKLAGAGQRRTKFGLLHQGSVGVRSGSLELFAQRARRLASALAGEVRDFQPELDEREIRSLAARRYGCESWTERRP